MSAADLAVFTGDELARARAAHPYPRPELFALPRHQRRYLCWPDPAMARAEAAADSGIAVEFDDLGRCWSIPAERYEAWYEAHFHASMVVR